MGIMMKHIHGRMHTRKKRKAYDPLYTRQNAYTQEEKNDEVRMILYIHGRMHTRKKRKTYDP